MRLFGFRVVVKKKVSPAANPRRSRFAFRVCAFRRSRDIAIVHGFAPMCSMIEGPPASYVRRVAFFSGGALLVAAGETVKPASKLARCQRGLPPRLTGARKFPRLTLREIVARFGPRLFVTVKSVLKRACIPSSIIVPFLFRSVVGLAESGCRSCAAAPTSRHARRTAIRLLALSAQHEQGLRKNNRAENSHQPVRRRERKMQRFKSPASAQRFLAVHATVYNLFNVQRHLVSRRTLRQFRGDALRQWRQVTTVA